MEYKKMGKLALSGLTLTSLLIAGRAHADTVNKNTNSNQHGPIISFNDSQQMKKHTRVYRNRHLYSRMRCSRVHRNQHLYQQMKKQSDHDQKNLHRRTDRSQVNLPTRHTQYQAESAGPRIDGQYIERFSQINQILQAEIGAPYAYGGTGPQSFDCSGFTQYVYHHGVHQLIPRTSEAQRQFCATVGASQVRPGDLAFFGQGSASHVGVYIGNDLMVDAQNRGVIVEHVRAPWWHLINFGRPLVPPSD